MEKIRLKPLDIVLIAIVGMCVVFVFIPVSPNENNLYSLFSFLLESVQNGNSIHIPPFALYIIFTLMAISLLVFMKKPFFRAALFLVAIYMFLLCLRDWPTRTFSLVIGITYLILIFASIVFDSFLYRRGRIKEIKDDK